MFRRVFLPTLLFALGAAQELPAQTVRPAFGQVSRFAPVPEQLRDRSVARARGVALDSTLFDHAAFKRLATDLQSGNFLRTDMVFFDDARFRVRWTGVDRTSDGKATVWSGDVEGMNFSQAVMVVSDTLTSANISTGDGRMFQIRSTEDGNRWVREIDQRQFPNEGPTPAGFDTPPPASMVAVGPASADAALADDGTTVDVMVLYTPTVTLKSGGANGAQQLVQLGIAETNLGYQNSGVVQRLRLVYSGEVQYTESGRVQDDLNRLTDPSDGYMDVAHRLRDTYNADLVSLWGDLGGELCGMAWLLENPAVPRPNKAFSVVDYSCATGYYSFGHEMGHNMGAGHAREDNTGPGAYAYSYGYKQPNGTNTFRTIMAYKCTSGSCEPRVNYWSNPGVTYRAQPTGISSSASTAAANYLTLNNTRSVIANYRSSTVAGGGAATLIESAHPYLSNSDLTYSYTLPGAAAINVTFDARTGMESGYDFLYVSDAAGNQILGSPFTGTSLANRTVTVPGATIKIRLLSDDSVTDYGFKVSSVTATGGSGNLPRLTVTSLTAPITATIETNLTGVRATLANQGTGNAGAFRLGYYYSRNRNVTTNDIYSGTSCTFATGLAAGSTGTCSGEISVPATLGPGVWYLAVIADDLNAVGQSDRTGNTRVSDSGTITIGGGTPAELTRPVPGSVLTSATATFQWSAGTGVSGYNLSIGTTSGGTNIYNRDQGTGLSVTVSSLPTNGATLYVRLTSRIASGTAFRDYTVAAFNLPTGANLPKLVLTAFEASTSGQPGVNLTGMSVTVANRSSVNAGPFRIGFYYSRTVTIATATSTFSGWNCTYGEGLAAGASSTCKGEIAVPSTLASGTWYLAAVADDQGNLQQSDISGNIRVNDNGPVTLVGNSPAALLSPVPGSTFSSSAVTFRWDTGTGADQYYLSVGYVSGGRELAHLDQGLGVSTTIAEVPTDGRAIYVRLWTRFNDRWAFNDYTYRAFRAATGVASPHIAVTSFNTPSSGTIGVSLQGTRAVITNQGNANAGSFRLGYYYSKNRNVTTKDIFSGWFCTVANGLAVGNSFTCSGDVGVPAALSAGSWYVAAIADDQGQVTQSDRSESTRVADTGPVTLTGNGGLMESDHPYANNTDRSWTYTAPNNPAAIKVSFDAATSVEEDFDYIYIYDGTGAQIPFSPFTADALANKTVIVPGATVRIRLVSDDSFSLYGFKVTSIVDAGALPRLTVTSFTAPIAATPGTNIKNMRVTVANQGSADAGRFWIGFYYSRSPNVSTYDIFSGWTCEVKEGLAVGATHACGGELGVPLSVTPGVWYLAAIADDALSLDQSDRRGNVRLSDNGVVVVSSTLSQADEVTQSSFGLSLSGISLKRE